MSFGKTSMKNLNSCVPELLSVGLKAMMYDLIDFSVIDGYRSNETQHEYFLSGKSKLDSGQSKHNKIPSQAFDAVPYINGKLSWNKEHCCFLAGIILTAARELGVNIRWGGNWDMDGEPITDQTFQDLGHYEIYN